MCEYLFNFPTGLEPNRAVAPVHIRAKADGRLSVIVVNESLQNNQKTHSVEQCRQTKSDIDIPLEVVAKFKGLT